MITHKTDSIPIPKFDKGDLAIARVKTSSNASDMTFSCVVLAGEWKGQHFLYLVEDVQSACTLLVPESQLSVQTGSAEIVSAP